MRNGTALLAFVLCIVLPSACSEDENWRDLESVVSVDNSLVLDKPEGDLELKLDLTKPELKFRVAELRDSIEQFMTPEFLLFQELGRKILRERGVDPDTAFSGGINDPRLAMVPAAAATLDYFNARLVANGLTIIDIYWLANHGGDPKSPTGIDTTGPFDDYWDRLNDPEKYSNENVRECLAKTMGEVGAIVAGVGGAANFFKVTGKAVLSFVGGATVVTVGGAIGIGGFLYWSYEMGRCLDQKAADLRNGITCSITITVEQDCKNKIEQDGLLANSWCHHYLIALQRAKWDHLAARLGADTLQVVVDPAFDPGIEFKRYRDGKK